MVKISYEEKRGCGWRKRGGLYLVADNSQAQCGRLPIPLDVCPICGAGIKPARGWTWIESNLIAPKLSGPCAADNCPSCPLHDPHNLPFKRAGLLWVGEKFYPKAEDFLDEAAKMGISRRLNHLPHGFRLGETWVMLAHRRAIGDKAGIFSLFKPERLEYIVRGDEDNDKLALMEKRGWTLVKVIREGEGEIEVKTGGNGEDEPL